MFSLPLEKVLWAEVLARVWDQVLEAASVIMMEPRLEAVFTTHNAEEGKERVRHATSNTFSFTVMKKLEINLPVLARANTCKESDQSNNS